MVVINMKKIFNKWFNFMEKRPFLGIISFLCMLMIVIFVWGCIELAIYGDPMFDKCMAEHNDREVCMTVP